MDNKNKIRWLRFFEQLVKSKEKERNLFRAKVKNYRAFEMDDLAEEFEYRISDLEMEIEAMYQERARLIQLIDMIEDPKGKTIIRMRDVDGLSWNEIAYHFAESVRNLQLARKKALETISRAL